jgi:hypothetical protein
VGGKLRNSLPDKGLFFPHSLNRVLGVGESVPNSLLVKRIFFPHSHRGVFWSGQKIPHSQTGVGVGAKKKSPHPQMGGAKTLLAKVKGGGPMAHGEPPYPFPFEVV